MRNGDADFFEQVVDREVGVAHLDGGIEQTGGANHLIDVHTARFGEFILVGGGADIDDLVGEFANSSNLSGRLSSAAGRRKP